MNGTAPLPYTIHRLGDRALLVDLPDLHAVLALRDLLSQSRRAGVDDIVPATRTLAVLFDPKHLSADAVHTWLDRVLERMPVPGSAQEPAPDGDPLVVDVVYDGEDLAEVAGLVGITTDELIRRHTDATWRVAFSGFAPGFGYLVTDDEWFDVPRRSTPRTRVPAGAVGLAGGFSGAYPREGPGGWQLIGRTDAPLWRPADARPALLAPGTTVRFRAVEASSPPADARTVGRKTNDRPHEEPLSDAADRADSGESFGAAPATTAAPATAAAPAAASGPATAATAATASAPAAAAAAPAVTVLQSGPQLLVEDLGRPASASIGAGRSGALDRGALRLGNRLVGNAESAAGLEVVVAATLRFEQPTWFAVTGARGALKLGRHPIEPDAAVQAAAGDVLELGTAVHGLRYVVALRGGVAAQHELDSASADIGARLGPAPLVDGDTIALADDVAGDIPAVDALTVWSPPDDEVDVHVVAGPRQDWFAPASIDAFYDTDWQVTQESNRVGARLRSEGVTLQRSNDPDLPAELPSEPMVPGAIQVPPSGEPTVLLADGPVTGGYPV
ncbi:carboxyltransferase domain-containing protein, partial [Humibacter sp.]|uniref:5-oxoprolinase subunit B/C family protein n=1 Tax=Humibacter sp. TaxID=1940291 RepID=UPI003F7FE61A